jgi:hypothetical protein
VALLFAVALAVKLFWYIVGVTAAIVVVVSLWSERGRGSRHMYTRH